MKVGIAMDKPVRVDIFLQHLSPHTLDDLKQVREQGLIPVGLEIVDDLPILRFERPKARLLFKGGQ